MWCGKMVVLPERKHGEVDERMADEHAAIGEPAAVAVAVLHDLTEDHVQQETSSAAARPTAAAGKPPTNRRLPRSPTRLPQRAMRNECGPHHSQRPDRNQRANFALIVESLRQELQDRT